MGIELPNTGNIVKTRAIVLPLAIGIVVTLLAAMIRVPCSAPIMLPPPLAGAQAQECLLVKSPNF